MTSKVFALKKKINEAKERQREINYEAMTYSDCAKYKYEVLA